MQRVRVGISRLRRYSSDTVFEVFGDLGDGTIDYLHPLTPRPVALWPDAGPRDGHLLDGHLTIRHADGVNPDGHIEDEHLSGEHLYPALTVTFDTPGYVFGRFQHAVKLSDGAGNESSATSAVLTVNSAPTVPEGVTRSGYDSLTDQLTFLFRPSRFEPVSGK